MAMTVSVLRNSIFPSFASSPVVPLSFNILIYSYFFLYIFRVGDRCLAFLSYRFCVEVKEHNQLPPLTPTHLCFGGIDTPDGGASSVEEPEQEVALTLYL